MALSFRNCHTKIRHVDAHATLNEGVVVQVMGELSNNMQPMRKFMQTFVLAPEVGALNPAPPFILQQEVDLWLCLQGTVANKFYVHNDVFRYQDEVFADSDSEPPEGEWLSVQHERFRPYCGLFINTLPVWVPESEDEVEEIEERVPSPDAAAEDSAPFYDQAAW